MMNQEEILKKVLSLEYSNICIEAATGIGKTRLALELMKKRTGDKTDKSILIVVPKNVLKSEWIKEISNWNFQDFLPYIQFSTYISLPKHVNKTYDCIIYDECHHISDRCRQAIPYIHSSNNILLSATIKRSLKYQLNYTFNNLYTLKVDIKEAIDNKILPEPTVLLIPLKLNSVVKNQVYIKRKSKGNPIECTFNDRWNPKYKNRQLNIICTQQEYYDLLAFDYGLAINKGNERWKRQLAIDRLKWLSAIKNNFIRVLLGILSEERTLTFCNDINQCESLGDYPIHSKDKESLDNLVKFNNGEINHITSCAILNEGANIKDLRIGIFAYLNSSQTPQFQKIGRILRHRKPVIIIPYYLYTREEEIVNNMIENFNKERIKVINNLTNIKTICNEDIHPADKANIHDK